MKQFKNLSALLLVLLTMAIFTTSCQKDDDDAKSDLIGTWTATFEDYGYRITETFEFKSDGTGKETSIYNGETETWDFKWKANEKEITFIDGNKSESIEYTMSKDGKALTLFDEDKGSMTYYKQ